MREHIYAVNLDNGCIGLLAAPTIARAWRQANDEEGRNHVESVRMATPDDISWVASMGGYVPDAGRRSRREAAKGQG